MLGASIVIIAPGSKKPSYATAACLLIPISLLCCHYSERKVILVVYFSMYLLVKASLVEFLICKDYTQSLINKSFKALHIAVYFSIQS